MLIVAFVLIWVALSLLFAPLLGGVLHEMRRRPHPAFGPQVPEAVRRQVAARRAHLERARRRGPRTV
jgi:hypothetical protein